MPIDYVRIKLRNSTLDPHIYHATDNNAQAVVLTNCQLGPGETTDISLFPAADGTGSMTYGFTGNVDFTVNNLRDGDPVDCC